MTFGVIMPHRWTGVHLGGNLARSLLYADAMSVGVLAIVAIVLAAVALMVLVGREQDSETGPSVTAVVGEGLLMGDGLIPWSSIFEITLLTRRELGRTWFGFEIQSETHGLVLLDGSAGPGESFLAECHRFPGFDHAGLTEALSARSPRLVCYSR